MPAQRATGGRPLLGTDDGAASANRFGRRADGKSGLSTSRAAATDRDPGNNDAKRWATSDSTAQSAARPGIARASRGGNDHARANQPGSGGQCSALRQWNPYDSTAANEQFLGRPCAPLGIFQFRRFEQGWSRGRRREQRWDRRRRPHVLRRPFRPPRQEVLRLQAEGRRRVPVQVHPCRRAPRRRRRPVRHPPRLRAIFRPAGTGMTIEAGRLARSPEIRVIQVGSSPSAGPHLAL